MRNKPLVATGSVLFLVLAAVVIVARRARTEHPPVSPTVPRIEDLASPDSADAAGIL
ncbi:hypothetical protein [Gordonia zhaorongruii]|uniref:hypothetical protein n=1 Tax=Gordonia zhaorongruii TaxID=2597659 RepID=UPI001404452A|nr:hypothetical protein [Gordonia zhaorongruii]